MTQRDLLLGVDVGTTGVKVQLIDSSGQTLAQTTREYPLSTPRPLWSEQDPAHWWAAAAEALREVAGPQRERIACIGLTGQMHGLVLLDSAGAVLRPAILWNDQRTGEECAEITERVGASRVVELIGNPVLPGFTAPKIEWVRKHEPEVHARIAHVLLPKDWLRYKLTGALATDVADASGTALFEVRERTWSDEMLEALGVERSWLPEVFESAELTSEVSGDAAELCGLRAGTPVAAGAGDQAASAVGAGLVSEGEVSATLGTSGVVFAVSDTYRVDAAGRLHAFCHAVPGKWHLMGVVLAAGGSLRWMRDTLCADLIARAASEGCDPYELMLEEAAGVAPGCEGLLFLPYLTGERTPHPDPLARGAFVGLTLRHGRAAMTRAVVEGVSFALRDSLELMRELELPIAAVRAAGGGARSPLWSALLADVFEAQVVTSDQDTGSALGAALIAGVGCGLFPDFEASARALRGAERRLLPDATQSEVLRGAYQRYRALYPALRESFAAAARDA